MRILAEEPAADRPSPRPTRPVHTFSIVARDPKTGEIGVDVQSHWFAIGLVDDVGTGKSSMAGRSPID